MTVWILAAGAVLGLAAHERLTRRGNHSPWLRCVTLLAGVTFAVLWGAAARPHQLLIELIGGFSTTADRPSFVASGDTILTKAASGGSVAIPPPTRPTAPSLDEWQRTIRARIEHLLVLPEWPDKASSPALEITDETRIGTINRRFGWFAARDGTHIPAFQFVPEGEGARPAVLVIPGHGAGIAGTAGLIDDYQHAAALRLAEAGFVTLTPELRGFGYLGDPEGTTHRFVAANALALGSSYKAYVGDDLRRALELLRADPRVDRDRIGVAGASFGGELSVFLASLDPSIRAVCCHAHGGSTGPFPGRTFRPTRLPHGCHIIPGINRIVGREDWFRLLAPRPLQLRRGDGEPHRIESLIDVILPLYESLGRANHASIARSAGGHEFFVNEAITFFRENL